MLYRRVTGLTIADSEITRYCLHCTILMGWRSRARQIRSINYITGTGRYFGGGVGGPAENMSCLFIFVC